MLVVMTEDVKTIACMLFPGIDPLDLIGPMQALNMLAFLRPGWRAVVVAERIEAYETEAPLRFTPSHTFDEVPSPDVLVVPGASTPAFRAMTDETLLNYIRNAAAHAEVIASVCSGSLLLGAAGLLEGRKATTHWTAFDLLAEFRATPVRQRWVHDGPILTAAGQSAGIDMGLYLVQHLAGIETARLTQFGMEYDPEPTWVHWTGNRRPMTSSTRTRRPGSRTDSPKTRNWQHVWSPGCALPPPLDRARCVAGWPR